MTNQNCLTGLVTEVNRSKVRLNIRYTVCTEFGILSSVYCIPQNREELGVNLPIKALLIDFAIVGFRVTGPCSVRVLIKVSSVNVQ